MSETLRRAIEDEGGLATRADLARFWGLSERRVSQMEEDPSFPAPVAAIGTRDRTRLWTLEDAAAFRPPYQPRSQV